MRYFMKDAKVVEVKDIKKRLLKKKFTGILDFTTME